MGSVTYNFLADSLFFHKDSLENEFANETDERIEKELQDYRNHCINNYEELISRSLITQNLDEAFKGITNVNFL